MIFSCSVARSLSLPKTSFRIKLNGMCVCVCAAANANVFARSDTRQWGVCICWLRFSESVRISFHFMYTTSPNDIWTVKTSSRRQLCIRKRDSVCTSKMRPSQKLFIVRPILANVLRTIHSMESGTECEVTEQWRPPLNAYKTREMLWHRQHIEKQMSKTEEIDVVAQRRRVCHR